MLIDSVKGGPQALIIRRRWAASGGMHDGPPAVHSLVRQSGGSREDPAYSIVRQAMTNSLSDFNFPEAVGRIFSPQMAYAGLNLTVVDIQKNPSGT